MEDIQRVTLTGFSTEACIDRYPEQGPDPFHLHENLTRLLQLISILVL
jgi:hypothetical protein